MTRYRCLVLDHDDTAVFSTPQIHYPAFCEALQRIRPGVSLTLEDYYLANFHQGFVGFCRDKLGMNDEEMEQELETWKNYTAFRVPDFIPGIPEVVRRQKQEGGFVCVVSHSLDYNIRRDYLLQCGVIPDLVLGWEQGEGRRKPEPWPLREIMRRLELSPRELLMVDDMKPGCLMARAVGVDFAYAGWALRDERTDEVMSACSDYFLNGPEDLAALLFDA